VTAPARTNRAHRRSPPPRCYGAPMHALDRIRALLAARTAGLSDLVTAVHRVNPTDRRLPPAEEAERYRLKAALQSRLLRDYPAHVEVVADGEDLVLLRCPTDGRDAAHVPVTALDDDVRVLVRERLDGIEPAETPVVEAPSPTSDPLADGRAALEAWDYEGAATAFGRAARAGSVAAARQAIELFVEMLGDLDGARTLAAALPPATRRDPTVRVFRALAEARSGPTRRPSVCSTGSPGIGRGRLGRPWPVAQRIGPAMCSGT
jgi:hypothetical protein